MELVYNFMDFVGFSLAVIFVFYWAYAGNLLLNNERNIPLKLCLFVLMLGAPLITPLFIYAFYHKGFNSWLRSLKKRINVNA